MQIKWMCGWAQDKTGRKLKPNMPKPNKKKIPFIFYIKETNYDEQNCKKRQ